MTRHVHHLTGCRPTPLAHYLKALGILRVVAEQADPAVRGWWQDEHFHLLTTLNADELTDFLADSYRPTPLVAPWNGGSGFYPKDNKSGIDAITASQAPRLRDYRDAITMARNAVGDRTESPKNEDKQHFLANALHTWRAPLLDWLQAALVIDEQLEPRYPALLGTGGNDGRLDFTNNFMQRLAEILDLQATDAPATQPARLLLDAALHSDAPTPGLTGKKAIGQFLPGAAGGANSTSGFMGESLINPWDFILMLEGTMVFTSGLTRRANTHHLAHASAPFALHNSAIGFATATDGEDSKRGEQWLPLWSTPTTCPDIRAMFTEARCQSGVHPASRPNDAAQAIARHGTARGITAFERVGYLERNGQANLAIPLGRWTVDPQPHSRITDHAARWIDRFGRKARSDSAPASWQRAARRCDEALLACCRDGRNPDRWFELLIALGAAEQVLGQAPAKAVDAGLKPLAGLPGTWLDVLQRGTGDKQRALRLALAFADQVGLKSDGKSREYGDPIRKHCLPLDGRSFSKHPNADVVALSGDLQQGAIAILRRRLRQRPNGHFNLIEGHHHSIANLSDLAGYLAGTVDEALIWALARPLMALDHRRAAALEPPPVDRDTVDSLAAYGLLRLAHQPSAIPVKNRTRELPSSEHDVRCDPTIIPRLLAGDAAGAARLAVSRLRQAGLRPHLGVLVADPREARRLTTALLFPISRSDTARLAHSLTHVSTEANTTTEGVSS